jgi:hypothetical protein
MGGFLESGEVWLLVSPFVRLFQLKRRFHLKRSSGYWNCGID